MLKNKLLLLSAVIFACSMPVLAEDLADVTHPKAPAYRLGISAFPERQYVQAQQERKVKVEKKYAQLDDSVADNIADRTYADLSIKNLSKEIAQDLEFDEQDMIADLSLLWQGAAQQSDTINFALYKLANPDADKPDEKSVKNVLKTIASMSTIVGASMGNPLLAGSSLLGGNIFGIMSQDTKALNYKYTRVTDADMIILIRKIEDLQQNAVNLYYDYISAKKQLDMANDLVVDRQRKFELAQKNNAQRELVVITDAYYRTALDKQRTAKAEFYSKRAALEQFVGTDTFLQFESEYIARENGENVNVKAPADNEVEEAVESDNPEYNETIKTVENYKKNLEISEGSIVTDVPAEEVDKNLLRLPSLLPFEDSDHVYGGSPTGLAAGIQDIFGFQRELNAADNSAKKRSKEEKRAAKQFEKEKKAAEKALQKQIKENEKQQKQIAKEQDVQLEKLQENQGKDLEKQIKLDKKAKKETEKQLAKQAKKDAKAQKKLDKELEKQTQKEEKALRKIKKEKEEFLEEEEEVKEPKLTRAEKKAKKKEEKRLAKEKAAQEKEAKKNKDPLKGMIFLHGKDKSLYRHHHYFSGKPPVLQDSDNNEKNVSTPTLPVETSVPEPTLGEILPPIPVMPQAKPSTGDLMGLPPLDAIRAPELTRGGYSIHSEY